MPFIMLGGIVAEQELLVSTWTCPLHIWAGLANNRIASLTQSKQYLIQLARPLNQLKLETIWAQTGQMRLTLWANRACTAYVGCMGAHMHQSLG